MYYFKLLSFPDQTFIQTGKVLTDTNVSDKFLWIAEKLWTKYQTLSVWSAVDSYLNQSDVSFGLHFLFIDQNAKPLFKNHICQQNVWLGGVGDVSPGLGLAWFGLKQSNIFFLSEPDWVLNIKSGRAGTLIEKFKAATSRHAKLLNPQTNHQKQNMGQSVEN